MGDPEPIHLIALDFTNRFTGRNSIHTHTHIVEHFPVIYIYVSPYPNHQNKLNGTTQKQNQQPRNICILFYINIPVKYYHDKLLHSYTITHCIRTHTNNQTHSTAMTISNDDTQNWIICLHNIWANKCQLASVICTYN